MGDIVCGMVSLSILQRQRNSAIKVLDHIRDTFALNEADALNGDAISQAGGRVRAIFLRSRVKM